MTGSELVPRGIGAIGVQSTVVPIVTSYIVLGGLLVLTRLVGLGRSFWYDEILTVTSYVRGGPGAILSGAYLPNNHELFSLIGWVTVSAVGESEVALRLWSAVPFIVGALLVTVWLHVRVGVLTAVLFLFFVTVSPMLLDLSRGARGYELAFLAMSVLIVAAFEVDRTGRTDGLAVFFAAGLVGTWTLPIFGVAFIATALVLVGQRHLRRRSALGIALSTLAIALWYAPHFDDLLDSSGQRDGSAIPLAGILVAPVDQVLIPGMLWFGDTFLTMYPGRLVAIGALGVLLVSSPLIRERRPALILGAGAVATLVCLWVSRLYLQPRFVSYLLVPLFIVLANGTATVIPSVARKPRPRALIAASTIIFATAAFVGAAANLMRLPAEAWKDAASAVTMLSPQGQPVLAYVSKPLSLDYYLDAEIRTLTADEVASRVCAGGRALIYVTQPYDIEPVDVPCLARAGVRHVRLRQHSRGGEINVWLVPPRT